MLEGFIQSIQASGTIPYEVGEAFKARISGSAQFSQSSKSIDSEDVSINEAGAGSHVVLDDPDYFLKATLSDGSEVAVPAYTV